MNKKYTSSSLLYKLTLGFSSGKLHRSCLLNVKSPRPKRHICLSEDKTTLIPPLGLEMKLKGRSGGICPIGLERRSHKALLLPSRIAYFSNAEDRIDINYPFLLFTTRVYGICKMIFFSVKIQCSYTL